MGLVEMLFEVCEIQDGGFKTWIAWMLDWMEWNLNGSIYVFRVQFPLKLLTTDVVWYIQDGGLKTGFLRDTYIYFYFKYPVWSPPSWMYLMHFYVT